MIHSHFKTHTKKNLFHYYMKNLIENNPLQKTIIPLFLHFHLEYRRHSLSWYEKKNIV